ncbi:unnamed protein product [Orchesella dallaii]|uniref:Translationally-controlled tumor protein n=1 Tax=Orchesella dallaii TaxID=48710 RepID=A0ABP1R0Z7_9HEXA
MLLCRVSMRNGPLHVESTTLIIESNLYTETFGAIAQTRQGVSVPVRQDEEGDGEAPTEAEADGGGGEESTTVNPDTLMGTDRFVYGFNSLIKAIGIFFQKIDKKVEKKVMSYEGILNFIHDKVHPVNGTEDFHETAYITMKV